MTLRPGPKTAALLAVLLGSLPLGFEARAAEVIERVLAHVNSRIITQSLFETLGELNRDDGIAMLVVEQNAALALGIARRGYVLETGSIVVSGPAADLATNDDVRRAYLGI